MDKILSVVIPVYNEETTIEAILKKVEAVKLTDIKKEIIVVDDCSADRTAEILKKYQIKHKIIRHPRNRGKGAAIRTGLKEISGDFAIIQDADLEYDPEDYPKLLKPLIDNKADAVYGSRFVGDDAHRVLYFSHYLGNKTLTALSNLLTNLNLTDMETGYKAFTKDAVHKILPHLTSERFGIEPEITAQIAKLNLRIYEVGISYSGRTYAEGKKITWKDGLAAIWHIIKFNLLTKP